MSTFYEDLKKGQKIEKEILKRVQLKYKDAYIVEGYCKEWDIYIPSEEKGIEVKYDPMSQKTGNLVVEVEYNNKPSALQTTKAYRWVFHTGKKVIITTPSRLYEIINKHNLRLATFTGPGDPHPKKAYLIRQELIEGNAILTEDL